MRGKRVAGRVPQAAAPEAHVLVAELADVDQNDYLVARNHQVLYAGFYHLVELKETDFRTA